MLLGMDEIDPLDIIQMALVKLDGGQPSKSLFSIALKDWTEKGMEFKVKFDEPLEIS